MTKVIFVASPATEFFDSQFRAQLQHVLAPSSSFLQYVMIFGRLV